MVADAVLTHALRGFRQRRLVLLLGCTHFPVFRHKLAALLGDAAVIVDSAQTTALQVADALKSDNAGALGNVTFLATDGTERFRRVGAYFLGKAIGAVELVKI
jgi:glutamate racemase